MASTPPLQLLSSPQTPSTPLHGALYERPTRQSSRIKQRARIQAQEVSDSITTTPRRTRLIASPNSTSQRQHRSASPRVTPRKPIRQVQVVSPESPNTHPTPHRSSSSQPFPISSTTTFSHGMLPTPVKTPKKKSTNRLEGASAALFQDPVTIEEMANATPAKDRKTKRYNGFSLESFRADDETTNLQIFTDNRDKVPEVDDSPSNPFMDEERTSDHAKARNVAGTAKRRKVSKAHRKDAQVEDAIDKDDGMVYVFRGKKVFRRFNDAGDDEEEFEVDEPGLLSYSNDSVQRTRPMRTLTRKSIKPKRLFESEEDRLARLKGKEEEIATDIDDRASEEEISTATASHKHVKGSIKSGDKKTSPFDKWPRLKKGGRGASSEKSTKKSAYETANGTSTDTPTEAVRTLKRKTRA